MKKFVLLTVIVLITALVVVGSVGSVSIAANTKDVESPYTEVKDDSSHDLSHNRYWAKESFTVNNKKGVIKDAVTSSDAVGTANSPDRR